ncbi:MAG: ABC transporter ATP-binding protein [Archangiaceae bacterium]|nr:ABC transporter ATP-binding protein [Archangiaceae bacterium]
MSDVAIELSHVTKHFGPKVAVNDVSFSVQQGQCYGLIGPNGAGKTTTFSMMCGFLHPTAGLLRIMGEDPSKPGALKGKVGVLPQDAILPATWPVGAFLTYLGSLSDLPRPEAEARAVLERVGLPEVWGVQCGALSHGMAKRVAMAQALMGSPPVVMLDEPTAGLDPKIAATVRQIIRETRGKATLVVSSHNLQELEELCDATAVLDKGRLVAASSMEEMTGAAAEFRVQVAKGFVPADDVKAIDGVVSAETLNDGKLLSVRFDGARVAPEVVITATPKLLVSRDVLVLSVSRGKRLEERVLQLT